MTSNSLVIGASTSAELAAITTTEKYVYIRVEWISTYSEQTSRVMTQEFSIRFYDDCFDADIVKGATPLPDITI